MVYKCDVVKLNYLADVKNRTLANPKNRTLRFADYIDQVAQHFS